MQATHSGTLAWKIPWTESLVGYSPWGCKDKTELFHFEKLLVGVRNLEDLGLPLFLCREEAAMPRCGFTAGAEVHRCLVGTSRLQSQGEMFQLVSRDVIPLRDISSINGVTAS